MILRRQEPILLALAMAFVAAAFAALAIAPAARLAQWAEAALTSGYAFSVMAWVIVAIIGHIALARRLPNRDPLLFPITMLLSGWGLALIWRLAPAFGLRQTMWLIVGLVGLLAVVYAPGDLRWLRRYRYLWLALALGLTALTLITGVNPSGGGPALWLGCCGLYFQPSEALKLLFVVFSAAYLAEKIPGVGHVNVPLLAPVILAWAFSLLLLVSQRDLGTGSLIFATFITLLYLATGRRRIVVFGCLLLVIGGALSYGLFDVVRIRVEAWFNPFADPSGRSFQIVQSLIALADGGLFGNGLGIGAPTVIPVVHSDFVFAAIVEEWGVIGGAAAILLIAMLVLRGFRTAAMTHGAFRRLLSGGLAALIGLQSILIIGGVIKLLPLTGVTLPFLSYGGSSLLIQFIIIGLLLKLSDDAQGT